MNKKTWGKPQLITIRRETQESVLEVCKTHGQASGSPSNSFRECMSLPNCHACRGVTGS